MFQVDQGDAVTQVVAGDADASGQAALRGSGLREIVGVERAVFGVLGTEAGTKNGAVWFDLPSGRVAIKDGNGTTQYLTPTSYVDAEVAGEAIELSSEIAVASENVMTSLTSWPSAEMTRYFIS